ncbi:hypothetical protein KM043_018258, partial [Ampulex compressa]
MGGEEGLGVTTGQPNLYKQDLSKLDVSKLTALSPEVISRQATINIGTIGHVAHGKSTIVKAISGVQTVRFKNELERNITIKLEARAVRTGSGVPADVPSSTREMFLGCGKRPIVLGGHQSRAKQLKLDEKLLTDRCDSRSSSRSSRSSMDAGRFAPDANAVVGILARTDEERARANSNTSDLRLKELKIVLEDVKYKEKSQKLKKITGKKELWEVERILEKKEQKDTPIYLIKWKNWGAEYNTWEPASNLVNCLDLLREFELERVQLVENFKAKVNFYPNIRDVEEYLKEIRYNGESMDCRPGEEGEFYCNIKRFFKQKYTKHSKLERIICRSMVRMLLCKMRREQQESLEDWEHEVNSITKGKPLIRVENLVDLEGAPQDFFYIDDYLPGAGVIVPEDPPIGCECTCCDSRSKCCFTQSEGSFPYTTAGRIRVPPGTPIYECNKRCTCDVSCPNRVVQRGADLKLCIFRTANGRGWGVKSLRAIRKGTFVTQYVGEVITSEEAERRGKEYDAAGRTYLFDLDYNETEDQCPYTVDAGVYGNVSHFINHSCDPNLAVYGVWIDCLDPNLPKLALFATRDIRQNEEITFDYMCQVSTNSEKVIKRAGVEEQISINGTDIDGRGLDGRAETPESETL